MTISEEILTRIDSTFPARMRGSNKLEMAYEVLKYKHGKIILSLLGHLNNVNNSLPKIGEHVFTITDMTKIGKGVFISDHYYNKHGFVSEMCYDDAYGFITHWVSFDTINALNFNPLDMENNYGR